MDIRMMVCLGGLGVIGAVLALKYERLFHNFFIFSTYVNFLLLILILKNKIIK